MSDCENPVIWLNEDGRKACAMHVTLDASSDEQKPHPSWKQVAAAPVVDDPKTPKTEESHKGWMFEWPALWLIAIAYMRFNRIPVPHLREMPSDSIADGANWHLTRYPNSENLYTLSRVDGMNKRLDLSRELDEDRANLKEAKATAQLAAGHLEKLEVEAFPDERKKYEALLKEKKEQIAQLQHDIPVKEKQYANALKEQSWTVDVKKLSPVVIAEGITRIYRKKDGTPIKTEDGQGT